jgi:GTP cyclohydrolase I
VIDKPDIALAEKHLKQALIAIFGEEAINSEGMIDTAKRIAGYWEEFSPNSYEPIRFDKTFSCGDRQIDQIVSVKNIPFISLCEHHLLPIWGTVSVAYLPRDNQVIGLSKIPRIVEFWGRRPQLQEKLGEDIKNNLMIEINPLGVAVKIKARHACMEFRGIRASESETVTSCLGGKFLDNPAARAEVLYLLGD